MSVNMFLLCISLCTFEFKSFLVDKIGYFQSFWNWNDILLFLFSFITLFQEIKALVKGKIEIVEKELL